MKRPIEPGSTAPPVTDRTQEVRVGPAILQLPSALDGKLLSDPHCPASCSEFVVRSPDTTIYHSPAYIDFARRENGAADMLVVRHQGTPIFAFPVHPDTSGRWVGTGYSGVLFAASDRESVLGSSVAAFQDFLRANRRLGFRVEQSAQGLAYSDPARVTLLEQLLWDERHDVHATYTRMLAIASAKTAAGGNGELRKLDAATLDNGLLMQYDGDIRNQIRQAMRRGLCAHAFILKGDAVHHDTGEAYRRYMPVQTESYGRTGMAAHPLSYWLGLSEAIQRGGGTDIVILVTDESGADVAGVTCHAYRGRAIYWSGVSTAAGKAGRANPLALHAAVTMCGISGVSSFEVGRFDASESSEKERAITRYKAQFRGYLLPVVNFVRSPQTTKAQIGALKRSVRTGIARIADVARKR